MKIKKLYNKWLYKKYKYNRGALFEEIPLIFRIIPLFSPSLYSYYEAEEIAKALKEGLNIKVIIDDKTIDKLREVIKSEYKHL